jgi:hypothetical protein
MKYHSLILAVIIAALAFSPVLAQEKVSLQPNATILSILQGNTGKTVELRMSCGEKIGGKSSKLMIISFSFPI